MSLFRKNKLEEQLEFDFIEEMREEKKRKYRKEIILGFATTLPPWVVGAIATGYYVDKYIDMKPLDNPSTTAIFVGGAAATFALPLLFAYGVRKSIQGVRRIRNYFRNKTSGKYPSEMPEME